MKHLLHFIFALHSLIAVAQYDGAAGTPGSLAIHKDSSAILSWGYTCQVDRGWLDISNKSLGVVSGGSESAGAGIADGIDVVSLGDSGVATITFNPSIANGPGPDFAIFENSFSDSFLELAFVEVSSNGVDFYRFPAVSNYPTDIQIGPFDAVSDPTMLHNLAGKYRALYGTPFDLSELDTIAALDINQITHVRVVDVVGSINPMYGTTDLNGNLINDPYPTNFDVGGFDLDAVAVLHQGPLQLDENNTTDVRVYPNPLPPNTVLNIDNIGEDMIIKIFNVTGKHILTCSKDTLGQFSFTRGVYLLHLQTKNDTRIIRLIAE